MTLPSVLTPSVAVVRVSRVAKREGEKFKSPGEQRERINSILPQHQLRLVETFDELDVSGKRPLHKRRGLSRALEMIESGHAKVLVVGYFDRLCRNISVKSEVVTRVERVGGRVLAVDFGEITEKTAAQWLSSTLVAAVSEYYARSVAERLASTQQASIEAGIPTFATMPLGYRRGPDRRIVIHDEEACVVREMFEMKAAGASVNALKRFLADRGIRRTTPAIGRILKNCFYLGELRFGKLVNPRSHPAIVDRMTFDRAQRPGLKWDTVPGRKSEQLLARCRLLKCATCKTSLVVGAQYHGGRRYPYYRCNPQGACSRRVSINAAVVEPFVVARALELLENESDSATLGVELDTARAAAAQAQAALDQGIINLAIVKNEPVAQKMLGELQAARDEAFDHVATLERRAGASITLNAASDFDQLSLDARRELICSVLERVIVLPGGHGTQRLRIVERKTLTQDPQGFAA